MESYATAREVFAAGLVFARVAAVVMLLPGVGEQGVPPRVRLGLALLFSLCLFPVVAPGLPAVPAGLGGLVGMVLHEILVGLLIGTILRLFLSSLSVAGEIVSLQTTLGFAQTANPMEAAPSTSLSTFLTVMGLTLIFVSHDLSVVDHLCDRVAVMYLGRIVEEGRPSILRQEASHHYTHGLASAIPQPIPGRRRAHPAIIGELPSPTHPPSGCPFRTRCPAAQAACAGEMPPLDAVAADHKVACFFPITPPAFQSGAADLTVSQPP